MDRRRTLGGFAVLALVVLRLAIGWHFLGEGVKKIERDPRGQYRLDFSAGPFLAQAKGPLKGFFQSLAPTGHDWQQLLAVPHQNTPQAAAPQAAPYQPWADRVIADWQAILTRVDALPGLTAEQIERAKQLFDSYQQNLKDYLASETAAIAEYQHELWRLDQWRAKPEADGAPFQEERIAKKAAETSATAKTWIAQVDALEQSYLADLRGILTAEQRVDSAQVASLESALTSERQATLNRVSLGAAILTIGVGICLLLGLFTRLASLAGAVFLLSIIMTQPPWLAVAEPTIDQTVELAGLLVLAGTGAGRWLGLDYFSWALFGQHDD